MTEKQFKKLSPEALLKRINRLESNLKESKDTENLWYDDKIGCEETCKTLKAENESIGMDLTSYQTKVAELEEVNKKLKHEMSDRVHEESGRSATQYFDLIKRVMANLNDSFSMNRKTYDYLKDLRDNF